MNMRGGGGQVIGREVKRVEGDGLDLDINLGGEGPAVAAAASAGDMGVGCTMDVAAADENETLLFDSSPLWTE